jgi:hypothetical protein
VERKRNLQVNGEASGGDRTERTAVHPIVWLWGSLERSGKESLAANGWQSHFFPGFLAPLVFDYSLFGLSYKSKSED